MPRLARTTTVPKLLAAGAGVFQIAPRELSVLFDRGTCRLAAPDTPCVSVPGGARRGMRKTRRELKFTPPRAPSLATRSTAKAAIAAMHKDRVGQIGKQAGADPW